MPLSNINSLGSFRPDIRALGYAWRDGANLPCPGWNLHRAPMPEEEPLEPLPGEEPSPEQEEPPPHPDPSLMDCCSIAGSVRQG